MTRHLSICFLIIFFIVFGNTVWITRAHTQEKIPAYKNTTTHKSPSQTIDPSLNIEAEKENHIAGSPEIMWTDALGTRAEIERRFIQLRSELLNQRSKSIDLWLAALALILTFFGIVVAVAGFFGFTRFRQIEAEAGKNAKAAEDFATQAKKLTQEIVKNREKSEDIIQQLTAQVAADDPNSASQAIASVRKNPESSLLDRAVADAISLHKKGQTMESLRKWHAIAELAEDHDNELAARAWHSVGFLVAPKDLEYSITANDRAIELNPKFANAYVNRGAAKHALKRYEDAIGDYSEALRLDPKLANCYSNRGVSLAAIGKYRAAIADHDRAIQLKPEQAPFYANRGVAKDGLGEHEVAITDHDKAIQLAPQKAEYYSNRGASKADAGRCEEALEDHNEAIRLEPFRATFYDNRGCANLKAGHYEVAVDDFNRAIELDPKSAKAYNNRGNAYLAMSQFKAAIGDYEVALSYKPDFAGALNNRGEAKAELGQYEAAKSDFDEALRLNPNLAESLMNRGKANEALGCTSEARNDYEAALAIGSTVSTPNLSEQVEELLRNLETQIGE